MDLERWRQIDALLQSALEREPAKRSEFLEEACSGDQSLKDEVQSLLASGEQALSLIDSPAFELTAGLLSTHVPELIAGQLVGPYKILSFLGAGGMGEVYLAQDMELGRQIALKLLPAEFTRDKNRLRRFQQEARTASALNHPNILTIHQIGQSRDKHFIATEFVDGETIRQYLKRSVSDLRVVLDIAIQVASALGAAHQACIVHRDLKPENIMIRRDGYVKVLDFGLAKLTEQRDAELLAGSSVENVNVSAGLVMGTVKYMSPEQAQRFEVDHRSDIFSLGVVLYEMVAGHLPFEGETANDVIAKILKEELALSTESIPGVPDEVLRILSKALMKAKIDRYQTIEELWRDLKNFKDHLDLESKLQHRGGVSPADPLPLLVEKSGVSSSHDRTGARISNALKREVRDGLAAAGANAHGSRSHARPGRKSLLVLAGIFIVVMMASPIVYRWIKKAGASSNNRTIKVRKLTDSGRIEDAAISPDGHTLVYSQHDTEGSSLWLKHLATGSNVRILASQANAQVGLVFSRDGNHIFYTKAMDGSTGDLYRMPLYGGEEQKLIESVDTPIAFSPDSVRIAYIKVDPTKGERALMVSAADGNNPEKIYSRTSPRGLGFLAWSPDGQTMLCTLKEAEGDERGNRYHLLLISLADRKETELLPRRWHLILNVAWLPDMSGILMIARETEQDNFQLWQVAYSTGETRRITSDTFDHLDFRLSGDAASLVTVQEERVNTISLIRPGEGEVRGEPLIRGANRGDGENGVAWLPNGRIVYAARVDGNWDIWVMNSDGTERKRLTSSPDADVQPTVSSDGRHIVYVSRRAGKSNIWRMDSDGSNQQQLTSGKSELEPAVSRDGQWVLYTNWDAGKRLLYRVAMDGGTPIQVFDKNIRGPATVSPDGKLIAVFFLDEKSEARRWKISVMTFAEGETVKVLDPIESLDSVSSLQWTRNGKALTYAVAADGKSCVYVLPLDGSSSKRITNPEAGAITYFDWSWDGQGLLVARQTISSDAVLFKDFR